MGFVAHPSRSQQTKFVITGVLAYSACWGVKHTFTGSPHSQAQVHCAPKPQASASSPVETENYNLSEAAPASTPAAMKATAPLGRSEVEVLCIGLDLEYCGRVSGRSCTGPGVLEEIV